jgi:hypothetical protein
VPVAKRGRGGVHQCGSPPAHLVAEHERTGDQPRVVLIDAISPPGERSPRGVAALYRSGDLGE